MENQFHLLLFEGESKCTLKQYNVIKFQLNAIACLNLRPEQFVRKGGLASVGEALKTRSKLKLSS